MELKSMNPHPRSQNLTKPQTESMLIKSMVLHSGSPLSAAPSRGRALVPTDLSTETPEGTYGRIAPQSGLAWRHGIDGGAVVIDADNRGPVGMVLFNHSDTDFEMK